jgi:hypothetical protein
MAKNKAMRYRVTIRTRLERLESIRGRGNSLDEMPIDQLDRAVELLGRDIRGEELSEAESAELAGLLELVLPWFLAQPRSSL